jgi:hypothetical protein
MSTRRSHLAFAGLACAGLALALAAPALADDATTSTVASATADASTAASTAADSPSTLRIDVAPTSAAGSPIPVRILGCAAPGRFTLAAIGAFGTVTRSTSGGDPVVTRIDGPIVDTAGQLTILVACGTLTGRAEVQVLPGPAVDPVYPLMGPRAVVADGVDHTMIVSVPQDSLGNAIADGSAVELEALRPDGHREQREVGTHGLLAWVRLDSGTRSGQTQVRVGSGTATSRVIDLVETAGPPVSVELTAEGIDLAADGRRLRIVRTPRLVDRFGNVEPDGTSVQFQLSSPDGPGALRALTLDGIARVVVPAPKQAGTVSVVAEVQGVVGPALSITFDAAVDAVPVDIVRDATTVTLSVGPVLDQLAGFVPDGTIVTVSHVSGGATRIDTLAMRDGRATFSWPSGAVDADSTIVVQLLGFTTEAKVPSS